MAMVVGLVPFEALAASEGPSSSKLSLPFNMVEGLERSMGGIQTGSLGFYADGDCSQLSTDGHVVCKPEVAGYRGSMRGNQMEPGEAASHAISKGLQKLMGVTFPSVGGLANRVVRSGFNSKLVIGNTCRHIGKQSAVLRLSAQRGGRIYAAVSSRRTDEISYHQLVGRVERTSAAAGDLRNQVQRERSMAIPTGGMVVLVVGAFGSPHVLIGKETGMVVLVIVGSPQVLIGEETVHKDTVWAHVGFGGTAQRQLHAFTIADH